MEVPTVEEVRQLDQEETQDLLDRLESCDEVDFTDVRRQWYRTVIDEYRESYLEIPEFFTKGTGVTITYISGDEDVFPTIDVAGRVVSRSGCEMTVFDPDQEATYHVDMGSYTIDILSEDIDETIESREVFEVKYTALPAESPKTPLDYTFSMLMSVRYEWSEKGPYTFPSGESLKEISQNEYAGFLGENDGWSFTR
jgi:hypothetical protein